MRKTQKEEARSGAGRDDIPSKRKRRNGTSGKGDEIDSIFSGLDVACQSKGMEKRTHEASDSSDGEKYFPTEEGKRRHYEGLPVYSIEELQLGSGGDTEDCPIYCNCCF